MRQFVNPTRNLLAVSQGNVRNCVDQVLLIGRPFRPVDRPLRVDLPKEWLRSAG